MSSSQFLNAMQIFWIVFVLFWVIVVMILVGSHKTLLGRMIGLFSCGVGVVLILQPLTSLQGAYSYSQAEQHTLQKVAEHVATSDELNLPPNLLTPIRKQQEGDNFYITWRIGDNLKTNSVEFRKEVTEEYYNQVKLSK